MVPAKRSRAALVVAWVLAAAAGAARTHFPMHKEDIRDGAVKEAGAAQELDLAKMEVRLCVQYRAAAWPAFYERMTGKQLPEAAAPKLMAFLAERWEVKDEMESFKSQVTSARYARSILFSSGRVSEWKARLVELDTNIKDTYNFNYKVSKKMCTWGWTEEVRRCVLADAAGPQVGSQVRVTADAPLLERLCGEAGIDWTNSPNGERGNRKLGRDGKIKKISLRDRDAELSNDIGWVPLAGLDFLSQDRTAQDKLSAMVGKRLDLEEWGTIEWLTTAQAEELKELKDEIHVSRFWVNPSRDECIKGGKARQDTLTTHVVQQLKVVVKADDGTCVEREGEFCPEGTSPDEKRRYDEAKGAVWGVAGMVLGKGVSIFVGGLVGAAVAGPVGAVAGFAAGASFAATPATFPVALASSAAFSYYGGLQPKACGCFPNSCSFSLADWQCTVGPSADMDPSRNPIGAALPEQSLKCALDPLKPRTCTLQPCNASNFEPALEVFLVPWNGSATNESSRLPAQSLFGKVGRRGQEVLNCVSTDGHSTGALALATTLPDGRANTAGAREELFAAKQVAPLD